MRASGVAWWMLVGGLSAGAQATGQATGQTNGQPRVVLVELFTSEGCSSCPPADALLRKLDGLKLDGIKTGATASDAGEMIVGISEHVTYWNQLGWADPFSQQTYTDRQNAYGQRFGLDSVYTPQVVVNGERETLGSDSAAILKAVRMDSTGSPLKLHIDSANASGKALAVTFSLEGRLAGAVDVYAVIADDMATSSVLRGENSGRTLKHVSVARSLTKVATLKESKSVTVSLASPGLVKGQAETGRHLILFAQAPGLGKVLAVESKGL